MQKPSTHKSTSQAQSQPQNLSDRDLLRRMQLLVQRERSLVTEILHHLREVERRKLYSDLGYKSLFDYAVRELGYSEGQAGRRIQAMKLLRELPQEEAKELEKKIEDGSLNLTNICQAQSFFNEVKKASPNKPLQVKEKLDVLKELEHKSSRQGQAALMEKRQDAGLDMPLPKEKTRALSQKRSELRLVLNKELLAELEEVRALLGQKAMGMSWAELIGEMAALSKEALKDKKFGKRRESTQTAGTQTAVIEKAEMATMSTTATTTPSTPALRRRCIQTAAPKPRSISKGKRSRVWERDGGVCVKCGSQQGLQVDHIVPVALGGGCEEENLRLLCVSCNVREGVKDFGLERMKRGDKSLRRGRIETRP